MKYVSIDVETTGLCPKTHHLIEVAAIISDTEDTITPIGQLPVYSSVIYRDPLTWSEYCIDLHTVNGLMRDLKLCKNQTPEKVYLELLSFLHTHFGKDPVNVAGKNFAGFDRPFLEQLGAFRFRHRVLDPAMLWAETHDKCLPDMKKCLERAGLLALNVEHRALGDAACVIELIRRGL